MRALKYFVLIPALAFLTIACGPHHGRCGAPDGAPCRGGDHAMMMHHQGGGPGGCTYKSRWFSEGAVQSNGGVCQACNGGKWIAAEGCHDHGCCDHGCGEHGCGMMGKKGKKSMPCMHGGESGGGKHAH